MQKKNLQIVKILQENYVFNLIYFNSIIFQTSYTRQLHNKATMG